MWVNYHNEPTHPYIRPFIHPKNEKKSILKWRITNAKSNLTKTIIKKKINWNPRENASGDKQFMNPKKIYYFLSLTVIFIE